MPLPGTITAGTWTGLDPGTSAAKAAVLRWAKGRPMVARIAFRPTAENNRESALAALAELRQHGGWPRRAAVVMEGDDVIFRVLRLPALPEREVPRALYLEMERLMARPLDDMALDFLPLPAAAAPGGESQYLVVGAPQSAVAAFAAVLRPAGWARPCIEPHPVVLFRLWHLVHRAAGLPSGALEIIADLGATASRFLALAGPAPILYRSVPVGGYHFTRALALRRRESMADAEARKLRDYQEDEGLDEMETPLRTLLADLDRTMRHFSRQHGAEPSRLWLAGGGANWPALRRILTANLGIPVEPVRLAPLIEPPPGSADLDPRFALAVAAALRQLPDYAAPEPDPAAPPRRSPTRAEVIPLARR